LNKEVKMALALCIVLAASTLTYYFTVYLPTEKARLKEQRTQYIAQHLRQKGIKDAETIAEDFVSKYGRFISEWRGLARVGCNQTWLLLAEMHATDAETTWLIFNETHSVQQAVYGQAEALNAEPPDGWDNYHEVVLMERRSPLHCEVGHLIKAGMPQEKAEEFDREYAQHTPYQGEIVDYALQLYTKNPELARDLLEWANGSFRLAVEGDADSDGASNADEVALEVDPFSWNDWNDSHWLIDMLDTPEKVQTFLERFVVFEYVQVPESPFGMSTPNSTITRKTGDCGDIAALRTFLLKYHQKPGEEVWLVGFYGIRHGEPTTHASTLLKNQTGYYMLDFYVPGWPKRNKIKTVILGPNATIKEALINWYLWAINAGFYMEKYEIYEFEPNPNKIEIALIESGEIYDLL